MKSGLSPIDKLDKVLSIIQEYDAVLVSMMPNFLESRQIDISDNELTRIIRQLHKDGYIFQDAGLYCITFTGFLFVETGGYNEELRQKKITNQLNETVQSLKSRNDNLLVVGTWFAGTAALLLLLWQIFLYFYPLHTDYPFWIWETIPKKIK